MIDLNKMRVVVLTPVQMYPEARFMKSLVNMVAYSWHMGLRVEEMGFTEREVVDWARNSLAKAALDKECEYSEGKYTHFLWLDADHVFNPDLLLHLAHHDVDMVSALYYGRGDDHLPVVYVKDGSPDKYKHFPLVEVPDTLIEVDAIGFGALLMKREVMEGTPEPWFTIDYRAGEDIAFCVRARESGFKIHCDGAYKLGHVGVPPVITEETYLQYMEANKEKYQDRVQVNLEGRRYE